MTNKVAEYLGLFFPEKHPENLELTLHYQILAKKVAAIEENIQWISVPEPESQLTPLHLCAILGDDATAKSILEHSTPDVLTATDFRQWTPLHHAALREDASMLNLLREASKSHEVGAETLRNIDGATCDQLRALAFPQEIPEDDIVFYYRDGKRIKGGSTHKFRDLTGAEFTREMHASPEFFLEEWLNPTETIDAQERHTETFREAYATYKFKPPFLYLDQIDGGYGVFSLEKISAGTIVTEYLGVAEHQPAFSLYAMPLCDGAHVRNLAPMINDGFPNCVQMSLAHKGGLPIREILVAMRTIQVGEQLLWSYGLHPVKTEKYVQFGREESEKRYKEIGLFERLKSYVNLLKADPRESLETRTELTYFHYLMTTPSHQILLMLKEIISIDELYTLTQQNYFQRQSQEYGFQRIETNLFLAKTLLKLCGNAREKKALVANIECLFSNFRVGEAVKFLLFLIQDEEGEQRLNKEILRGHDGLSKLLRDAQMQEFWPEVKGKIY